MRGRSRWDSARYRGLTDEQRRVVDNQIRLNHLNAEARRVADEVRAEPYIPPEDLPPRIRLFRYAAPLDAEPTPDEAGGTPVYLITTLDPPTPTGA